MLSHVTLDLPTPMGVMLFSPSRNDVHLDFLGYVDWTLFSVALSVLLAAWTYANRDVAMRHGILSAVLLSILSWWLANVDPHLSTQLRRSFPLSTCRESPGPGVIQRGWRLTSPEHGPCSVTEGRDEWTEAVSTTGDRQPRSAGDTWSRAFAAGCYRRRLGRQVAGPDCGETSSCFRRRRDRGR